MPTEDIKLNKEFTQFLGEVVHQQLLQTKALAEMFEVVSELVETLYDVTQKTPNLDLHLSNKWNANQTMWKFIDSSNDYQRLEDNQDDVRDALRSDMVFMTTDTLFNSWVRAAMDTRPDDWEFTDRTKIR